MPFLPKYDFDIFVSYAHADGRDWVHNVQFQARNALRLAARASDTIEEISAISIDPAELIRDACSRLPRSLTRQEWNHYLPGEPYRATCPNLPLEPPSR